ncbi:TspO/MBR family protein [Naasia sp. SYSU D00948]|uniref:TspO/MBR family protein n=1 Tax=Naasia sp. SYSU D00948 TaxID=2817379 RepID=UPI001B315730|nr:TspO/MBR family protein [Naasia sp. SYSU D00948]
MSYSSTSPPPGLVGTPRRRLDGRSILALVLFLAASFAAAAFGVATTTSAIEGWYAEAAKVAWTPPNWLFGPVWTVLYILMAVAAWLVWLRRRFEHVTPALTLYGAQLLLNAVWSPIFFAGYTLIGPSALWVALAVILLLDICVLATILTFRPVSRTAAVLLLPYLAWILYATTLNWGIAVLNS